MAGSHSQAASVCGVSSKLPVESAAPQTPQQDLMKTAIMNLPSSHLMTGTPADTLHVTIATHPSHPIFHSTTLYSGVVCRY